MTVLSVPHQAPCTCPGQADIHTPLFPGTELYGVRLTGPYFYLPKMESHLEARLWNDIFCEAQDMLNIPRGIIKVGSCAALAMILGLYQHVLHMAVSGSLQTRLQLARPAPHVPRVTAPHDFVQPPASLKQPLHVSTAFSADEDGCCRLMTALPECLPSSSSQL